MTQATDLRPLGRTGLTVTALGMGTAPLGGQFTPVPEAQAREVLDAAWQAGLRYFDTAPMYGLGRCERLLGDALRGRSGHVLSTKVGRLMVAPRAGLTLPPEAPKNPLDPGWLDGLPFRELFDYSYDGVMRSFEDSRQRMGLTAIDLLFVHDIGRLTHGERHDHHWTALTRGGGFRALEELRANGDIRGFGLGVNETQPITEAMAETQLDVCLLAGRYSLIDRAAAGGFLDAMAQAGVGMVLGGVFNSGILAAPRGAPATFDYAAAPADIVALVDRVRGVCDDHGLPLAAAAVQFPLRHPAVSCLALGPRSRDQLAQCLDWFAHPIPPALWDDVDSVLAAAGRAV
ncbi:MAG: aldo/keto reductase [Rhodobacterales bacterium]|nr:aldo/keto reductase [Rhodobacterales bacterium]